jgi:RNA polymerase sigma-70 factor, ECF subfamily
MMTSAHAIDPFEAADKTVIEAVLAGDQSLFGDIVRRYNQRLFRVARSILRNDEDAEDAVQQTYLLAYRSLRQFRGESSFATWLTRITINESLGRVRGKRRVLELVAEEHHNEAEVPTTGFDELARKEMTSLMEKMIDDLPEPARVVFVLRDVEELDTEQTAAVVGISEEAVRVRLHRARAAIHSAMAEAIGGGMVSPFAYLGKRCERMLHAVMAAIQFESL